MGEFNGKISAEFTPPNSWVLNRGLSFTSDSLSEEEILCLKTVGANITATGKITCKKGTVTDLASTPRFMWNVIAPWDIARAAIIHDHLYASLREYWEKHIKDTKIAAAADPHLTCWTEGRAIADKIFLLAMRSSEPEVPSWKMYSAYNAVRVFGSRPASKGK